MLLPAPSGVHQASSRPYIRKKAVLVLYKIYLKYPQGLRLSFDRLKDKLKDPDPSVVSSAGVRRVPRISGLFWFVGASGFVFWDPNVASSAGVADVSGGARPSFALSPRRCFGRGQNRGTWHPTRREANAVAPLRTASRARTMS